MGSLLKTLTLRSVQGFCVIGDHGGLGACDPALGASRICIPTSRAGAAWLMRCAGRSCTSTSAWRAGGSAARAVSDMWMRGYAADVWMLFGTVAIGVGAGFALGLWCAGRADSRRARFVERAAVLLYCTPAYVLGLGTAPPVPSDVRRASGAVLLRRRADPGLAAVVAVGLVPLAARALARCGGAARRDVPAARRRAAPGAGGHRPRADRGCEGRAAQAGDPPPCRPVRACRDRVAGRRERADRRAST